MGSGKIRKSGWKFGQYSANWLEAGKDPGIFHRGGQPPVPFLSTSSHPFPSPSLPFIN